MGIEKIRVSIGSAQKLGLSEKKVQDMVTTCYLMTYIPGKCTANCGFCPQSRSAQSSIDKLSRISWPIFSSKEVLTRLKYLLPSQKFERICIQTLNYPENFNDLMKLVPAIKESTSSPVSTAIPPMSESQLTRLASAGVERVAISLDAATPNIFKEIKGGGVNGPYKWEDHKEMLRRAREIFPDWHVSTHLIIGLGETQREMVERINELKKLKILPGLFAFMPIKGTKLEDLSRPDVVDFRKIQLSRYLLIEKNKPMDDITYNQKGDIIHFRINKNTLQNIIDENEAFMTTGCPGCNRPYYTSTPSGPIYNFPRELSEAEKKEVYNQLKSYVKP
jgi:biotin synthase